MLVSCSCFSPVNRNCSHIFGHLGNSSIVSKVAAVSPNVEAEIEIPDQSDFYKLPARFGAIPLDEAPLGYEVETKRRETKKTKLEHAYPRIYLPLQEVQGVEFGNGKKLKPNDVCPD